MESSHDDIKPVEIQGTGSPLQYRDLEGHPIPDPKEKIRVINQPVVEAGEVMARLNGKPDWSKEEQRQFNEASEAFFSRPEEKVDYQAVDPESGIGITELWGQRNTQEDRVKCGNLAILEGLSPKQAKSVLSTTPLIIQEIIARNNLGMNQGSTLCTTVIQGNHVITANIGDSTAFACFITKDGKVRLEPLNKVIHHPEGGKLRIQGASLSVSHAIGDRRFESAGLSHETDLYDDIMDIPEDGKVFIINACDGLTERENMSVENLEAFIGEIYQKNPDITSVELARRLAQEAFARGSTDNISVMCVELDPHSKTPKYMSVFDGHGGDEVSEILSELYEPVLISQIWLTKIEDMNPEMKAQAEKLLIQTLSGKNIAAIQEYLEFFNQVIFPHIHRACFNSGKMPEEEVENTIKAAEQIIVMKEAGADLVRLSENTFKMYFSPDEFAQLSSPLQNAHEHLSSSLAHAIKMFNEGASAKIIRDFRREVFSPLQNLEPLCRVAAAVLLIRKNYDKKMPPSYSSEFAAYKGNQKRKDEISNLESFLISSFQQFPKMTPAEIIHNLLEQLTTSLQKTRQDHGKSLFKSDLAQALTKAIQSIQAIQKQYKLEPEQLKNSLRESK